MGYLHKLPLIMALMAALISGFTGFFRSIPQNDVLIRMVLFMVFFYIIGLFVRNTILNILEQLEQKRKEEELKEKERIAEQQRENEESLGQNIDFTAGGGEDSFEPLPVSEFIRKELKRE